MAEKTKLEIRKAISDYRNYVNETIVDAIIKPVGNSKESFAEKFIAKYMSAALKDTSSKEAQTLANILIKPDSLEQFQRFEASNKSADIDMMLWKINNTLYDKQQEVFSSFLHNAYKRYLIINSRRTGKTELMGRLIAADLISLKDAHVVYINRNSSAAIRQIKKPLLTALAQTNLQIVKGSVESQFIEFNNGSQLLIIGNNNAADIDRTRGERISLCIMDECGHQRNTRQIIREVIEPAMTDYGKEAKLVLVGTPPRNPRTYIEEIYNGSPDNGWKLYHWTFQENPHLPDRDLILEDVCRSNGVTEDSAFIQREYFGKMGVYDTDAMVFRGYKTTDILPNKTWSHAYVGVDWGYEDRAAVVACLADITLKKMYIVRTWTQSHIGTTETCKVVADMVEWLKENFHIAKDPWIIVDNNDKQGAADLCTIYKLKNVYCAYKYDLEHSIEELTGWLRVGDILTLKKDNDGLLEDFENTLWTRDEETDAIRHVIDDDIWHPNAAHALRYVSRVFAWDILGKQAKTLHNMVENTEPTKYEWRK